MKNNKFRNTKQKLKTAKGRKISSTQWLERHLNDPYVNKAKQGGYRSRAAFKISEIDDKFHIFQNAEVIIDLGAAPGGWLQVAKQKAPKAQIIGIDLKEMDAMEGVELLVGDFTDEKIAQELQNLIPQKADLIMSDMAANACGERQIDHLRIVALVEIAANFALLNLRPRGNFIAKMLKGGEEGNLLLFLRKHFKQVKYFKPGASYDSSSETYIVALNFKDNS